MTKRQKQTTIKNKKNFKYGKKNKKDFKPINKRGRLVVRNLPFKCTENAIEKHFAPYGRIIDINLLKRSDGKLVGCGFVEYKTRLDADKASQALNGKEFLGRPLYIERAVARDRFGKVLNTEEAKEEDTLLTEDVIKEEDIKEEPVFVNDENEIPVSDFQFIPVKIKDEVLSSEEKSESSDEIETEGDSDDDKEREEEEENENDFTSSKHNERKKKNFRKARLIVRNLSFKSTEEKLREHFEKYGDVVDVHLLRKDDNKLVGCGFVQFSAKQSAAKAIHYTSGKPFLDRVIIVDWAVAKKKFEDMNNENTADVKGEIKEEPDDEIKIKKEDPESEEENDINIKDEIVSDDVDIKSETESSEEEEDDDDDDDDDDDAEEDVSDTKEKKPFNLEPDKKKPRFESNDVSEGKTVFLKNVPFSVTNEELRKCMLQFGPVYYALVCVDRLTEHSKGTAFVKFKDIESAEKCLSSGTELTLKGVVLDPHPALKRRDASDKKIEKKIGQRDSRNLYLVKEGVILAGSPAAKEVSQSDMQRRLQLEQWKTQMLRNLNMFVSRGRLIVHNVPLTYDDTKLRNLFSKYAGPKTVIREARIMRDLKNVDEKGIGISKGYGFVSFSEHEDALRALRLVNNNPDIFTKSKRPIVAFSIENRAVLNAKTKRTMKSKQNNPLYKGYVPSPVEKKNENKKNQVFKQNKQEHNSKPNHKNPKYVGMAATPGSKKLRTKFNLKTEAAVHMKELKKLKHNKKLNQKQRKSSKEFNSRRQAQGQKSVSKVDQEERNYSNIFHKKVALRGKNKKKWYNK